MSFADGGARLGDHLRWTTGGRRLRTGTGRAAPIVMSGSLNNVLSAYGNVLTEGDLWLELVAPLQRGIHRYGGSMTPVWHAVSCR